MASNRNLLLPKDGSPSVTPQKDVVLGVYYLTLIDEDDRKPSELKVFESQDAARLAYDVGAIQLHERIIVRMESGERLETTVGRCIFNEVLPEGLRFVNSVVTESPRQNPAELHPRSTVWRQPTCGRHQRLVTFSRRLSTIAITDVTAPKEKPEMLQEADQRCRD